MNKVPRIAEGILFLGAGIGVLAIIVVGGDCGALGGDDLQEAASRGEHRPRAKVDVDKTADVLVATGGGEELESIADTVFQRFGSTAEDLPKARPEGNHVVPRQYVPERFWKLGGTFRGPPDVLLRIRDNSAPEAMVLRWGNGRRQILVFASGPVSVPNAFYSRRVGKRVYVVAN